MTVPGGLFMPVYKIGATLGRIFGEVINFYWFPVTPGAFAIAVRYFTYFSSFIVNQNTAIKEASAIRRKL